MSPINLCRRSIARPRAAAVEQARVRVEADDKLVSNEEANSDSAQEVDGVLF